MPLFRFTIPPARGRCGCHRGRGSGVRRRGAPLSRRIQPGSAVPGFFSRTEGNFAQLAANSSFICLGCEFHRNRLPDYFLITLSIIPARLLPLLGIPTHLPRGDEFPGRHLTFRAGMENE
ncbi:hypothetical protein AVEN_117960-1 [Araneus ventricosus]|uniref:Uncharacterized protein n=1 Tax=Araneus ventricosus TaxID=182803 RepID=A0A4Y2H470_ARAVE|nr:hypothetical protein AVEN_117960-1 [Araneus ventricosus]